MQVLFAIHVMPMTGRASKGSFWGQCPRHGAEWDALFFWRFGLVMVTHTHGHLYIYAPGAIMKSSIVGSQTPSNVGPRGVLQLRQLLACNQHLRRCLIRQCIRTRRRSTRPLYCHDSVQRRGLVHSSFIIEKSCGGGAVSLPSYTSGECRR